VDGDGRVDVVVATRAGFLFAWRTRGRADQVVQWSGMAHDPQNTGNYEVALPVQAGPGCGCATGGGARGTLAALILVALLRRPRRG
jgi:MYXO-CTERM domain-containing protein